MTTLELRPRFKLITTLERTQVEERFRMVFKNRENGFHGTVRRHHVVVKVPVSDQHFWSPQLDLSFDEAMQGTLIRGVLGPGPNVWTVFVFIYSAVGLLGVFSLMVGLSQYSLDNTPWGLWMFFLFAVLGIAAYLIAQSGKKMGTKQMHLLYNLMLSTVEHKVEPVPEF